VLESKIMPTFAEYYQDLLESEDLQEQELISVWLPDLITEVTNEIGQAVENSNLINSLCQIEPNSSNQSIGNQIATHLSNRLNEQMQNFNLLRCIGREGYPDRILVRVADDSRHISFEIKSTSNWNPNDTNRRVLSSSSSKLRQNFNVPIHHLICTVIYQMENNFARIRAVRLDFIEPDTDVKVRLEASVSHRILSNGEHQTVVFEAND
jgi:hypothetical protein